MNILVTRHDKIGDFITILPLLKILKSQTNYKIIVMVSKVNYELASSIDYIDDVLLYSKDTIELIKKIKTKKIDVSISCYIDTHLALALFLSNIKLRISPATKFAQIFFNRTVQQQRSQSIKTEWKYNIDLLKLLDPDIKCAFDRPLLNFKKNVTNQQLQIIAFHPGCGGSSEGNLTLDDYLKLAKSIVNRENIHIVFTFGPDDQMSKAYIKENLDFDAEIIDSNHSLVEFCKLLSTFSIFVSTSTGPMHLAGALNIRTLSFFGDSLFASSKRWAPISDKKNQTNFEVSENYNIALYNKVENKLHEVINNINTVIYCELT